MLSARVFYRLLSTRVPLPVLILICFLGMFSLKYLYGTQDGPGKSTMEYYQNPDFLYQKDPPANNANHNQHVINEPVGKLEGDTKPREYVTFDRDVPLIWVGGVPRSGTTLARAMLDAHPDIRCGEETRVIPKLLGIHKAMMSSAKESDRLSEAKITNKILNDALGAYILSIISKHGEVARRLCNKDPFTLRSMNKLMEIFPNSKFILMARDGRATCHSIISRRVSIRGFDFKTYKGCLKDWNRAIGDMVTKCLQQGPAICLPVRYESLIIHTNKTMQLILSFLNVPWSDWVLHHEQTIGKKNGVSLSLRELSTDQVNKPVNTDALTKWVGQIPNDVLEDMDSIAPMLQRLGYDPNPNPPKYGEEDISISGLLDRSNSAQRRERNRGT